MNKKIIAIIVILVITISFIIASFQYNGSELKPKDSQFLNEPDVIMPTKVSRPGCELKNSCFVPPVITINQGKQVIWSNEDVAFHTVTSGTSDSPTGLFDSGHLDPGQRFSFIFDEKGDFDYFCKLHPWMKGKVIVT